MVVYYGIVHDNRVELEGDIRLAEGTRVEVRPQPVDSVDSMASEELVKARLRAAGLLAAAPSADDVDEEEEIEPVIAQGEPLSEQIIRERR